MKGDPWLLRIGRRRDLKHKFSKGDKPVSLESNTNKNQLVWLYMTASLTDAIRNDMILSGCIIVCRYY